MVLRRSISREPEKIVLRFCFSLDCHRHTLTQLLRSANERDPLSKGAMQMGIVAWLVLGLVAGFIGSKLVNKQGEGMLMDIVLGIVGAVVGGFIAHFAGFSGITGFNIYSILIAIGGAVVVLLVYHALVRCSPE
jgi:uncharacterized membrane protein YeaQ/YmgE (transglycosylase-associated protein family)